MPKPFRFGRPVATPAASEIVEDGPITIDVVSRSGTANPFAITSIDDVISKTCLDWKVLKAKKDRDYLEAAFLEIIEDRPPSRDDGVTAFMCFEQDITKKEALALIKEFSALDPKHKVLHHDLIQKIHQVLRQKIRDGSAPRQRVGDRLGHSSLEFFLLACHHTIEPDSDAKTLKTEVKKALTMASIHKESICSRDIRMLSKNAEIDENDFDNLEDFVQFVNMAKDNLHSSQQQDNNLEGSLAQYHEAILGHPIIRSRLDDFTIAIVTNHFKYPPEEDALSAISASVSLGQSSALSTEDEEHPAEEQRSYEEHSDSEQSSNSSMIDYEHMFSDTDTSSIPGDVDHPDPEQLPVSSVKKEEEEEGGYKGVHKLVVPVSPMEVTLAPVKKEEDEKEEVYERTGRGVKRSLDHSKRAKRRKVTVSST